MPGKIGIRIPSHNSLTPSFLDELMKIVVLSRKETDAHKIRQRFERKYHIAIISTGLSYLEYLGALKKTLKSYRPTRLGKRIGRFLIKEQLSEANSAWRKLLKHHKLFGIFQRFFTSKYCQNGTLEEFTRYIRKRAHAKWKTNAIRSRISRLCELFADKGLIEYEHDHITLINSKNGQFLENDTSIFVENSIGEQIAPKNEVSDLKIVDSWPVRIEIKISVSDHANPKFLQTLLSFVKDLKANGEIRTDTT